MTDTDRELLDTYLDGALPPGECELLDQRLGHDPALAAALEQLRRERDARAAAFRPSAPAEHEADLLVASMMTAARRQDLRLRWRRAILVAAGAAACVTLGWLGRDLLPGGGAATVKRPSPQSDWLAIASENGAGGAGAFQVILTDETGSVLAVQRFGRLDEARRFATDLTRYQVQQERVREGRMVLVSDEF